MISRVEGWIVSPRKSRRKSACFSSTTTDTPARASRNPSIMPAGPPPAIAQRTESDSVEDVLVDVATDRVVVELPEQQARATKLLEVGLDVLLALQDLLSLVVVVEEDAR